MTRPKDLPFNACFVGIGNLMLHSNKRGEKTFSKGKKRERKARDVVCERNEAHSKADFVQLYQARDKSTQRMVRPLWLSASSVGDKLSSRVAFKLPF